MFNKKLLLPLFLILLLSLSVFAWYDTGYSYKRDIQNAPDDNLLLPFVDVDPDGDSSQSTYYGQNGSLYYNDDSDFIFANESSQRCGFSTVVDDGKSQQDKCSSLSNGLIHYWSLDNDNGWDMIGGSDGVLNGDIITGVNSPIGNAYEFDTSTDHLDFGNNNGWASGSFTISMWHRANTFDTNAGRMLQVGEDHVPSIAFRSGLNDGCHYLYYLKDDAFNKIENTETISCYDDGNWHHVVGTWDGSETATFYVDGNHIQTTLNSNINFDGVSNEIFALNYYSGGGQLNMGVDDVRIYDRALSSSEVQSLYDSTKDGRVQSLGVEETQNSAPDAPFNPSPADLSSNIALNTTLSVDVSDPDGDDMEVCFYDASDDSVINCNTGVANGSTTSVSWNNLNSATTYNWYAVANDSNAVTQSSTWSFTTTNPPNADFVYSTNDLIVNVNDSSSDNDGSITSYKWDWTSDGVYESTGETASYTYSSPGTYDVTLKVEDDKLATDTATKTLSVEREPPIIDNFTYADESGETELFYGEGLDYVQVDSYDIEDGNNLDVRITIENPEGVEVVSNSQMVYDSGNTFTYNESFVLESVGTYQVYINSTDTYDKTQNFTGSFEVGETSTDAGGRVYSYDYEYDYNFSTVKDDIQTFGYSNSEIRINRNTDWNEVSTFVQNMKNESLLTSITFYTNLSDIDADINYIQNNYPDLISGSHLNAMRHLKIYVDDNVAKTTSNSGNISSLGKTIFNQVDNKIAVFVRNYNHTDLNTNYFEIDDYIYMTADNPETIIEKNIGFLRNNSDKSRIYYGLSETLKQKGRYVQQDIINNMRSVVNISASNNTQNYIAKLENDDLIVANYASEGVNLKNISLTEPSNLDMYDLTNKNVLEKTDTEFNISLPAASMGVVYFSNLSKIDIEQNDNKFLYGVNERTFETNQDYMPGNSDAFLFVSSDSNPDDGRIIFTDPNYRHPKFYTWYGTAGYESIADWSRYDKSILADKNNETWVNDVSNETDEFYGYVSVNDYGDNNEPDGCTPGVNCTSWNRTKWLNTKKSSIDNWTIINDRVNIFIDGLDIGEVNDVDGMFEESLVELADYVKNKGVKLGLNTYTSYADYANMGHWTMRESACSRWGGSENDPDYSYENISLERERADYHNSHDKPVLAQAFGPINDSKRANYCYMQSKVLYGDLADYSYNQPDFDYTNAEEKYQWNYFKYPKLGSSLQDDYEVVGNKTFRRRFENGIVTVNASSHTYEYTNDETINNMSLCGYYYDNDDSTGGEGYMHFVFNDNLSQYVNVHDDDLTAYDKTKKCVNVPKEYYNKAGFYEVEFYYIDPDGDYTDNDGLYMYHGTQEGTDRLSFWEQTLNDHPSNNEQDYWYYETGDNWALNFSIDRTNDLTSIDDLTDSISRNVFLEPKLTSVELSSVGDLGNIPVFDRTQHVDGSNFEGIYVNDTKLNVATGNCIVNNPTYDSTLVNGEEWKACRDNVTDGYDVNVVVPHLSTQTYTISTNNPPTVDNVTILDDKPDSKTNLTGYCNGSDADGDNLTYEYDWLVNNNSLGIDNSTLLYNNFVKDDNVTFECRVYDGTDYSNWDDDNVTIGNIPPDNPQLNYPVDNAETISTDPLLNVTPTDYDNDTLFVTFYNAENDDVLSSVEVESGQPATYEWTNIADATTYEWYVIVDDLDNKTTSQTWNFTTNHYPEIELNNPENNDTGLTSPQILNVTVSDYENQSMNVKFYDGNSTLLYEESNVSSGEDVTYEWFVTESGTWYNWSVVVSDGVDTVNSVNWKFRTNYFPDYTLNNPEDGEHSVWVEPVLNLTVEDLDSDLMNVTIKNGSGGVIYTENNVNNGTDVSFVWENLSYGTTYNWSASIYDSKAITNTPTWNFTTNNIPDDPVLNNPNDSVTVKPTFVNLNASVFDKDGDNLTVDIYLDKSLNPVIESVDDTWTNPVEYVFDNNESTCTKTDVGNEWSNFVFTIDASYLNNVEYLDGDGDINNIDLTEYECDSNPYKFRMGSLIETCETGLCVPEQYRGNRLECENDGSWNLLNEDLTFDNDDAEICEFKNEDKIIYPNVSSNSSVEYRMDNLKENSEYSWYVESSDEFNTATSENRMFTTTTAINLTDNSSIEEDNKTVISNAYNNLTLEIDYYDDIFNVSEEIVCEDSGTIYSYNDSINVSDNQEGYTHNTNVDLTNIPIQKCVLNAELEDDIYTTDKSWEFYIGGVLNITGFNRYDNTDISGFNYSLESIDTQLEKSVKNTSLTSEELVYNLTRGDYKLEISHPDFINKVYDINMTSSDIDGDVNIYNQVYNTSQVEISFYVNNINTGKHLTDVNLTFDNQNTGQVDNIDYRNGTKIKTFYGDADTYNISFEKDSPYFDKEKQYTFDVKQVSTESVDLFFNSSIYFYDEDTFETYDFTNPLTSKALVICDDNTQTYEINATNYTNPKNVPVKCDYRKFKFVLTFADGVSFYRTKITQPENMFNQSVYLIDMSDTSFIYSSFIIDDLMTRFENPEIWIKKKMSQGTVHIQSDYTGVEDSMGAYLVENDEYILEIHSSNKDVQVVGHYSADVGESKIINLYDINLDSDPSGFDQTVQYDIGINNDSGNKTVEFSYSDSQDKTNNVQFKLYENNLDGNLIYESDEYVNTSYISDLHYKLGQYSNSTIVAELIIDHEDAGIKKPTKAMNKNWAIGLPLNEHVSQDFLNWFFLILLSVIAISASIQTSYMSLALVGIALLFTIFGWMTLSFPVLGLAILFAIVDFFSRKRGGQ